MVGVGGVDNEVVGIESLEVEIRTLAAAKRIHQAVHARLGFTFLYLNLPRVEKQLVDHRNKIVTEQSCSQLLPALLRLARANSESHCRENQAK